MTEMNMVELLERQTFLVSRLQKANMEEMVDVIEELTAFNPLVKQHIEMQKKLYSATFGDRYNYNKTSAKVEKTKSE